MLGYIGVRGFGEVDWNLKHTSFNVVFLNMFEGIGSDWANETSEELFGVSHWVYKSVQCGTYAMRLSHLTDHSFRLGSLCVLSSEQKQKESVLILLRGFQVR
jgi:hypothetical protein